MWSLVALCLVAFSAVARCAWVAVAMLPLLARGEIAMPLVLTVGAAVAILSHLMLAIAMRAALGRGS